MGFVKFCVGLEFFSCFVEEDGICVDEVVFVFYEDKKGVDGFEIDLNFMEEL